MLASDHSQSFSLFTSSRNSGVEEYPVPELIKSLIRYAGVEICSPTFLQFTLSPYEFISMARDIRDEINRLVSKLDSSTSEEDVWNDFDRYTGLIDPTEDALLNFLEIVERESRWLSLNDDGAFASMENYQSWIEQWVDRRMGLYRFLSRLVDQNKKLSEDYINSFLRQNTKAFMQDLYRRMEVALQDMKKNGKEIPPEASKTLTSLRRMIEEFGSHPFNGPIADRAAGLAFFKTKKVEHARDNGYELPSAFFENVKALIGAITDLIRNKELEEVIIKSYDSGIFSEFASPSHWDYPCPSPNTNANNPGGPESRTFHNIDGGYTEQDNRSVDCNIENFVTYREGDYTVNNNAESILKAVCVGGALAGGPGVYAGYKIAQVEEYKYHHTRLQPALLVGNKALAIYLLDFSVDQLPPLVLTFVILSQIAIGIFSYFRQNVFGGI